MKLSKKKGNLLFSKKRSIRGLWSIRLGVILIIITVGSLAFYFERGLTVADTPLKNIGIRNQKDIQATGGNIQTINSNAQGIDILKGNLDNYIKNLNGKYGIYFYNLTNGDEFGINDEEVFTAASTIKIPLNLYLYTKIKSGSVNPEETLTYLQEDYEEGTGEIQNENFGKTYSVKELSRLSIVSSDNVAANMLFRFLDKSSVKDYMREVGGTVVDNNQNISCPKDMGLYMKLVYEFYMNEGSLGKELMDNFLNTEFNDRIPVMLPQTVKVAHKIGTEIGVVNDVGIVFADTPYIISVMSKDVDENESQGVIANISKKVYDFVSGKPGM